MSVVLVGRSPYQARARLREDARRARPRDARLVGQHDRRRGRVRADGRRRDALAVLRAAARPQPALRLRPGARDQAQAAHVLELASKFLVAVRRTSRASSRRSPTSTAARRSTRPLDRWLVARTHELVARGDGGLRGDADRRRHPRLRGVRRRPLELVHPPLAPALLRRRRGGVPHALVRARPVAAGGRAGDAVPHRPPLAQPRRRRASRPCTSPAGPRSPSPTRRCSPRSPRCGASSSSAARRARAPGLKLRQPLRRMVVAGARAAPAVTPTRSPTSCASRRSSSARWRRRSSASSRTCRLLGPKLGAALRGVRAGARRRALRASSRAAASRSTAHVLEPDEVLVERIGREGWALATDGRRHGRARHDARRRAAPRGPAQRPDPRRSRCCARSRASRSPTASGSGSPTRTCSPSRRPDRRGDARARLALADELRLERPETPRRGA